MLSKRGSVGYRMKDSPCARSALLRISIVRPSVSHILPPFRVGRHGNVEMGTAATCLVLCCVVTLAKQKAVSPAPWSQWWPQNPSQHAHVARHLTWLLIALDPTLPATISHSNGHAAAQWAMQCQLFTACTAVITSATA